MSTGIPKTNFTTLYREFEEHISEIRKGAAGLMDDPPRAIRRTIIFSDMTKLSCQEYITDGVIDFYHYDYYNTDGSIIIKFHSEPHEEKAFQTDTEPFHMHIREDDNDLKASKRVPNAFHKELSGHIIPLILVSPHLKYAHVHQPSSNDIDITFKASRKGRGNKKR